MSEAGLVKPLTTYQVAKLSGYSIQSIANWADQGVIPSYRTPGGHRRFRREDVEAFLAKQEPAA